jgi:hypothetical protein
MQALNSLLEAQALVKKRQVSRQQSAQGGPGNNNRNYDVSALFDKELHRLQETRYETRQPSAGQGREERDALEKIAELARRQDEMLKRQQDLARQRLDDARWRGSSKATRSKPSCGSGRGACAQDVEARVGSQNAAGRRAGPRLEASRPRGSCATSRTTCAAPRTICAAAAQAGAGGSRASRS